MKKIKTKMKGLAITFFIITISTIFIVPSTAIARQDLMPAPRLYAKYPTTLVWKWHHENPYRWNVYISIDDGITFFLIEDYWHYGYSRSFAPDGGSSYMYIVGVDIYGNEVTRHSNIVRPDDAKIKNAE